MSTAETEVISPRLFTSLLAAIPDPVWVIDSEWTLLWFNEPFVRYYKTLNRGEPHRGMRFEVRASEIRDDRAAEFWVDLYARVLNGRLVEADGWLVIDGVRRHLAVSGTPVEENGAVTSAIFIAWDVTGSLPLHREDGVELALTGLFSAEESLPGILSQVIEFLCEGDEWQAGVIWLYDEREDQLAAAATWFSKAVVRPEEFGTRLAAMKFKPGRGIPGRVFATGEMVWVPDLMEETGVSRASLAAAAGLGSVVGIPVQSGGRCTGVVELFARAVRPVTEARKESLLRTGTALARLIERYKAEEERRWLHSMIERKGTEWTLTLDSVDLPVFLTTLDGTVVRVNRAARDLVGRTYTEILGRQIATLEIGEPWKTIGDLIAAVSEGGVPLSAQVTVGDRVWDMSGSAYSTADGAEERAVVVLRDITTVVRLQESVRRGEQLAALGELVAGVAHEVRNPLFGLTVTVDALETVVPRDKEVDELLVVLRRWLERLNRLMEDLLEYGKTWTVDLQPGRVTEALRQAVANCEYRTAAQGVKFVIEYGCEAPILTDRVRLVYAFENIIQNAIQHSPRGGSVWIRCELNDVLDRPYVEVSIRDQGDGFPAEDLPKVFQPFFTRRRGGTGLGLSIVQRVVDQLGGTVHAENHDEGGGVVVVRLPLFEMPSTENR
ncbi:MAG TPA: ATP-binding protein [Thermoanaerobaculia bacterium]|nr:ATP-binding protein [Thermoanaerobaculia bacterium]